MREIGALSSFIIMALVLPGIILISAVRALFPGQLNLTQGVNAVDMVGMVMLLAVITAHPAMLLERALFDRIWHLCFPTWRLFERRSLVLRRAKIISAAEAKGISHKHLDQTLGEFILFTNTSPWLILLAAVRLSNGYPSIEQRILAVAILVGAASTLLTACPYFKKSYLDILEELKRETAKKL